MSLARAGAAVCGGLLGTKATATAATLMDAETASMPKAPLSVAINRPPAIGPSV